MEVADGGVTLENVSKNAEAAVDWGTILRRGKVSVEA